MNSTGDDSRPDGRISTPETLRLRAATRSLRLHLDALPVDYDEDVAPNRFLAGLAFMLARNRYDCAESLIGSGFGGTVMGAMARSLLIEGLRWLWIAQDPDRRFCILGDLLEERSRIASLLRPDRCPTLTRFLIPIPPVADLGGASRTWLDARATPEEDALLDQLFTHLAETQRNEPDMASELIDGLAQAHQMLDLAGLRGAAMVLAHAGHGNYLGQRSTLPENGMPGFDLRADHEALFMHVAAVGTFAALAGTSVAASDAWPHDVDRTDFLAKAAELARDVSEAAAPIHGIAARSKAGSRTWKDAVARTPTLFQGPVVVEDEDVGGELLDIDRRLAVLTSAMTQYFRVVRSTPPVSTPPPDGLPLHAILGYGSTLSNLQTVMATYDQPAGSVMSVFAARALLEEAARLHWRYSVDGEDAFKSRAKQYFDEYRYRQRKTIRILAGEGIDKRSALRLFMLPSHVLTPPGVDSIAKNRAPIPTVAQMLRSFGTGSAQPDWLEATYALLSQVTHATPLGYLHCLRHLDGQWVPNELSVEMFALTLDAAAVGSAHLLGIFGLLLDDVGLPAQGQLRALKAAATAVHIAAREIHGLDLSPQQ